VRCEDAVVPILENYLSKGRVVEYIQDAQAYLKRYPSSDFSPRVALDILMVAGRIGNRSLADKMKVFLLFENSHSVQGIHILSTFKNATEFKEFILEHAESKLAENPNYFPYCFSQLIESGLYHFKNELLDDGKFLLISYCIANAAGKRETAEILHSALNKLSKNNPSLSALLAICIDNRLSTPEKIIQLHEQKEDTAFLETFYLSTLSQSEKKQPNIGRILIENAITSRDYKDAQIQLDAMSESFRDDPQILFWQGWIYYSLHNDQQALDAFRKLNKSHPKSFYSDASEIYLEGIHNVEIYKQRISHEIFSAFEVLKSGIGILQANIKFIPKQSNDKKQAYSIYVGLLPKNNFLEMVLHKNNEMILGYRTSHRDSAIYLVKRKKILIFNEPGAVPVPTLSLQREDNGDFTFNVGIDFSSSIEDAGVKTSSLFDSPYLSTVDGIHDIIDHIARKHGWVLTKFLSESGSTTFGWGAPSTDSPDLKRVEYTISDKNIITNFKGGNLIINDLQYDMKPSFRLNPPPWPQVRVERSNTFDFSILMEFMGAVIQLFTT
jgi:hypothetical protein